MEKLLGKNAAIGLLVGALSGAGGATLALNAGKVIPNYHVHGLDLRRGVGVDGGVVATAYGTMTLALVDGGVDRTDLGGHPCDTFPARALEKMMNDAEACLR